MREQGPASAGELRTRYELAASGLAGPPVRAGFWPGLAVFRHAHAAAGLEVPEHLPALHDLDVVVRAGAGGLEVDHARRGRRGRARLGAGEIMLNPAAQPCAWRWRGDAQVLGIWLDPGALRRVAGEMSGADPSLVELRGRLGGGPDPFVAELALRLDAEAERGAPGGALMADALVQALAVHLLRGHSNLARLPPRAETRAALPPWRLRRALDLLNDRLAEDVTLAELASAAGLSPVYFARQFRRATGLAPHRYRTRERVRRAQGLLRDGGLPLAEVALACGFCDQAHLTRAFRAGTGTTPAAYRRAARG